MLSSPDSRPRYGAFDTAVNVAAQQSRSATVMKQLRMPWNQNLAPPASPMRWWKRPSFTKWPVLLFSEGKTQGRVAALLKSGGRAESKLHSVWSRERLPVYWAAAGPQVSGAGRGDRRLGDYPRGQPGAGQDQVGEDQEGRNAGRARPIEDRRAGERLDLRG